MLSHAQIQQFKIDGYLTLTNVLNHEEVQQLRAITEEHLLARKPPLELEAEVKYPGAPDNKDAEGGQTIRRLRMAYQRAAQFQSAATHPAVTKAVQQILGGEQLWLNPNHHNCIMTKLPQFSSETHWHRDTRYWNFDNKYLINAWWALGHETLDNGCMKIMPGSHRWEVRKEALDAAQFLLPDHRDNRNRLETARLVTLNAGDVLLFSAHCFHAAGKNTTDQAKFSMVFSYHNEHTKPIHGTPSADLEEIHL